MRAACQLVHVAAFPPAEEKLSQERDDRTAAARARVVQRNPEPTPNANKFSSFAVDGVEITHHFGHYSDAQKAAARQSWERALSAVADD